MCLFFFIFMFNIQYISASVVNVICQQMMSFSSIMFRIHYRTIYVKRKNALFFELFMKKCDIYTTIRSDRFFIFVALFFAMSSFSLLTRRVKFVPSI